MSTEDIASIFNEWARRYAESPDEFGEMLDENGKPFPDYGSQAADYFQKLATEVCSGYELLTMSSLDKDL